MVEDPLGSKDATATCSQNICLNQGVPTCSASLRAHGCVGKGPHAPKGVSVTLQKQSKSTVMDEVCGTGRCQLKSSRNS